MLVFIGGFSVGRALQAAAAADVSMATDAPTAADAGGVATSRPATSSQDMAAAYAASGLKRDGGLWVDECGTAVEPRVTTLHLGGAVGDATMIAAEDGLCFGNAGDEITLFRSVADRLVRIEQDQTNDLIPLRTTHLGVADIQLSLPGFAQPVLKWDGNQYVTWRTIKVPSQ